MSFVSPELAGGFFTTELPGKPKLLLSGGVFSYVKLSLIPTGAEYCFFLVFLSRPGYVSLYFHNNKVKRK